MTIVYDKSYHVDGPLANEEAGVSRIIDRGEKINK